MKISKKAQSEIVGLMVIVILIIVVFGIYVSLSGSSQKEQLRDTKTVIELSNLIQATMHYTICSDTDLHKAFINCLEKEPETCGRESCKTAEKEFAKLLKAYELNQGWKIGYALEKENSEEVIFENKVECKSDKRAGSITLLPNIGRYTLRIERCMPEKTPK